jgi:predicted SAM-dependent methyltransferase
MKNLLKLNLGSGGRHIYGWHNLDRNNKNYFNKNTNSNSIRWEAPKLSEYKDNSVNFIYNEHFIEHLDEVDGFVLLGECYRVLKNNGVLRICTPSIDKYVYEFLKFNNFNIKNFRNSTQFLNYAIYGEGWKNNSSIRYLENIENINKYTTYICPPCDHRYIYSLSDITEKLKIIGFSKVDEVEWRCSSFDELSNLENHPGRLELIIEAVK